MAGTAATVLLAWLLRGPFVFDQASLLAGHLHDAPYFGWRPEVDKGGDAPPPEQPGQRQGAAAHDWGGMVQGVQNFIKGLNFKYRTDLRSNGVSGSILGPKIA